MSKSIRETGTFDAVDNAGNLHTIRILTEFIELRTRAGTQELAGIRRLKTSDGQNVNRIEKGEYEIATLGIALTSSDPRAIRVRSNQSFAVSRFPAMQSS
jgi:hypothetical protein